VLLHVIEPVKSRLFGRYNLTRLESNRRVAAEEALDGLLAIIPCQDLPKTEVLIVSGDPARRRPRSFTSGTQALS
jgi:hypothetical protein